MFKWYQELNHPIRILVSKWLALIYQRDSEGIYQEMWKHMKIEQNHSKSENHRLFLRGYVVGPSSRTGRSETLSCQPTIKHRTQDYSWSLGFLIIVGLHLKTSKAVINAAESRLQKKEHITPQWPCLKNHLPGHFSLHDHPVGSTNRLTVFMGFMKFNVHAGC